MIKKNRRTSLHGKNEQEKQNSENNVLHETKLKLSFHVLNVI